MPIFTEKQRRKLDEMRRESHRAGARLTPEERLRRSDELRRMAEAMRPGVRARRDETPEIMRRWRRRLPEGA